MMKRNLANDPPPPHGRPSETSPAGWGGRRNVGIGLLTLLFFIGGFGNWSVLTEISGAVVAAGRLEVEGRRQIVQHPTGGVVDEILARDGDRVEAGAVLLRLEGEKTRSELAIIEGQHFELLVRMDRLAAERDGRTEISFSPDLVRRAQHDPAVRATMAAETEQFELRRAAFEVAVAALRERQIQIGRQGEGLKAQRAATARQKAIVSQTVARQQSLFGQGIGTKTRLQEAESELAQIEGREGAIAAALPRTGQGLPRSTSTSINFAANSGRRPPKPFAILSSARSSSGSAAGPWSARSQISSCVRLLPEPSTARRSTRSVPC